MAGPGELRGAGMAVTGVGLPYVETGIAMALLLSGLLVACRVKAARPAGMAIAGLRAIFHGYAHGIEMPLFGTLLQSGGGFLLTRVMLVAGAM